MPILILAPPDTNGNAVDSREGSAPIFCSDPCSFIIHSLARTFVAHAVVILLKLRVAGVDSYTSFAIAGEVRMGLVQ